MWQDYLVNSMHFETIRKTDEAVPKIVEGFDGGPFQQFKLPLTLHLR